MKVEKNVYVLFHAQTAQNGAAGGQSIDTAVCQQGAAVSYSQEGNAYSGLDGTFKSPADAKIAALPGAGVALMGAYTGGSAPGPYINFRAAFGFH